MTSLAFAALLQATILTGPADTYTDTYADAHREAVRGKLMVVLVSTQWCAPCQTMKKTVIPEVRRHGVLKQVAFAVVDPDRQRRLASQVTRGSSTIPQLVMYRKTHDGWKRRALVGGQNVDQVEKFINEGIPGDDESADEDDDEDDDETAAEGDDDNEAKAEP